MANKKIRKCLISLVFKKMEIQITMKYQWTCTIMVQMEKAENAKCWLECERTETPTHAVGRSIKWYNHYEICWQISSKALTSR